MPKGDLAVVTMVFNEPDMLPIWREYYGKAVGFENCYIVDHASTDLSTLDIAPFNVIRIPRSPLDDVARAKFLSGICSALLTWFHAVAYTDVDEILVPDPERYPDLPSYARAAPHDVTTAFGMDVVQVENEAPLDPRRPILSQRHYVWPFSSLCKPTLIRRPVNWSAGFHYADAATEFDDLLLFHLAYADYDIIRRRQRKRRSTPRVSEGGEHHDFAEDEMVRRFRTISELPRLDDADLRQESACRREFSGRLFANQLRLGEHLVIGSGGSEALWRIPERFRDCF